MHDLCVPPPPCKASPLYGPVLQMQYLYRRYSFSLQYQEEVTEAKKPKNKGNFTTQYLSLELLLTLLLLLLQWLSWWGQSMHCDKCQRLRECGVTHRYASSNLWYISGTKLATHTIMYSPLATRKNISPMLVMSRESA